MSVDSECLWNSTNQKFMKLNRAKNILIFLQIQLIYHLILVPWTTIWLMKRSYIGIGIILEEFLIFSVTFFGKSSIICQFSA